MVRTYVNTILTKKPSLLYSDKVILQAGVVELVDAPDSKSGGAWHRVGSIPTSGTISIPKHFLMCPFKPHNSLK